MQARGHSGEDLHHVASGQDESSVRARRGAALRWVFAPQLHRPRSVRSIAPAVLITAEELSSKTEGLKLASVDTSALTVPAAPGESACSPCGLGAKRADSAADAQPRRRTTTQRGVTASARSCACGRWRRRPRSSRCAGCPRRAFSAARTHHGTFTGALRSACAAPGAGDGAAARAREGGRTRGGERGRGVERGGERRRGTPRSPPPSSPCPRSRQSHPALRTRRTQGGP
jgi:hypothetical protein